MLEKLHRPKPSKNLKAPITVDMLGKLVNASTCVCLNKYLAVVFERAL